MPFAQGLSLHPDPAEATGEVVGAVLDRLGPDDPPDLAVLFASPHYRDDIGDIAATVRALVRPGVLVGATAAAVVGGDREVEDDPALTLWAGRLAAPARPLRLEAIETGAGVALAGLSVDTFDSGDTLVLVADPFTFPVDVLVAALGELDPPVAVIGGLASASAH